MEIEDYVPNASPRPLIGPNDGWVKRNNSNSGKGGFKAIFF